MFARDRGIAIAVLVLAVAAFLALAIGDVVTTSPTSDEAAHLLAGYTYLRTGDYRINTEHPPLLKKIAALPLMSLPAWPPQWGSDSGDAKIAAAKLRTAWERAAESGSAQWEVAHFFFFGRRDAFANARTTDALPRTAFVNDTDAMFTRGRLALLITGVLAIVLVFFWSVELWGWAGAILPVLLIAFDPNFIANSGLVTTDVGVSALMCGAVWFFWRCCRRMSAGNIAGFATFFALAQVAKFSALLLVPIIGVLVIHRVVSHADWSVDVESIGAKARALGLVLGVGAVVTVAVIWAAYGFQREASPGHPRPFRIVLDDWYTVKSLQAQYPDGVPDSVVIGSRSTAHVGFLGRTIAAVNDLHVLPEGYLYGFAQINRDSMGRYAFLRGDASERGFHSYFLWTFLYKTTIPALIAIVLALTIGRRRTGAALPYLLWPVAIYMAVAIASSMNIGHRHILPIYPFLYVLAGSLAGPWRRMPQPRRAIVAALATAAIVVTSIFVVLPRPAGLWGRHLSFMNALGGGPRNGWENLVDSNFDWGQDLKRLGDWDREHNGGRPLRLVYFGPGDPRYYGVPFVNETLSYVYEPQVPPETEPAPGYFAISASKLQGVLGDRSDRFFWRDYLARWNAKLVDRAGYSILIYDIPKR